jgi:serine/threonine protein kinase
LHLSDFGLAKNTSDRARKTTAMGILKGTTAYLAPEFLQEEQKEKPDISK